MSGFDAEFPGQVVAINVDATTPESTQICKDLGFSNHGLVIRDSSGEVIWTQPDHDVVVDDVRAALRELVKAPSGQSS